MTFAIHAGVAGKQMRNQASKRVGKKPLGKYLGRAPIGLRIVILSGCSCLFVWKVLLYGVVASQVVVTSTLRVE